MNLHKSHTTIIAISGEWNEIVAKMLQNIDYSLHKEKSSMKQVKGYTTAPLAIGEIQGANIMHLQEMPEMKMSEAFLYKNWNGHERWFQTTQFKTWDKNIICIDHDDLETLKNGEGKEIDRWKYKLITVQICTKDERSTNPQEDFLLNIEDDSPIDVVFKKVKMLHAFIQKNKKGQGLWL